MEQKSSKNGPGPGEGGRGYRFVLRPKWILSHLLVLLLVVVMINLGFWQLRRLDQRREFNAGVKANATAAPAPLPSDLTAADVVEWRPFTVAGTYEPGSDVLVANRTLDGQPGYWLVTRLDPSDGSTPVAVVRGFVTRTLVAEGRTGDAAPPPGEVTVTGYAQKSRGGGRLATDTPEGAVPEITRVDLGRLDAHWHTPLAPVWLQLEQQQGAPAVETLTPVPLPPLDEGPHLSYAIQWFIFSTIAIVGYPLILRRHARARDDEDDDDPYATGVRADNAIH